jgi:hypothetical protein
VKVPPVLYRKHVPGMMEFTGIVNVPTPFAMVVKYSSASPVTVLMPVWLYNPNKPAGVVHVLTPAPLLVNI